MNHVVIQNLKARFIYERHVYQNLIWYHHPIKKIVWRNRVKAYEDAIRCYYSFIQKQQKLHMNSTYGIIGNVIHI